MQPSSVVSFNQCIFQCLYFYFVLSCLAIYFQCYTYHGASMQPVSQNVKQTTIEQLNGIPWDPVFIQKLMLFFIHVQSMGLDIILYWKTLNSQFISLNFKMILCDWLPICLLSQKIYIIKNLFQELFIFKTELVLKCFNRQSHTSWRQQNNYQIRAYF